MLPVLVVLGVFLIGSRVFRWTWLGKDRWSRFFWGSILVVSVFVLALLILYFTWKLTFLGTIFVFVTLVLTALALPIGPRLPAWKTLEFKVTPSLIWLCLACLADVLLLGMFVASRADAPIISPWNLFSVEPFILWGTSTFLLFLFGKQSRNSSIILGIIHLFVGLSVSATIYGIGFGFDPFLHRAATEELVLHGIIHPQQLLYSGQYVLVSALHFLTGFSVRVIDIWILPISASILLPIGAYIGLRDGWGFEESEAKTWWMTILLLPFMLATFTVPFTWTYVWFLLVLFILPVSKQLVPASRSILLIASVVMITFQPLLAVPIFAWVLGYALFDAAKSSPWKRRVTIAIIPAFMMLLVCTMFLFYQHSVGAQVTFLNLFDRFSAFTQLFQNPFYDPYPNIPVFLEALYAIRYWSPMLMILLAISVYGYHSRATPFLRTYLVFIFGMLGSILILSTLFYFRDIIAGEQLEFSKRLLTALYASSLPAFALLGKSTPSKWRPVYFVAATLLILHSWYFSYPQFNQKYPFYSASVSAANVETVRYIDAYTNGMPYLVLSDQMTSAAAIQEFHFAHYLKLQGQDVLWYPIPTGGPLYTYYSRVISGEAPGPLMQTLREETGVTAIFLVLPAYWQWSDETLEQFEHASDEIHKTSDGQMIIYVFAPNPS